MDNMYQSAEKYGLTVEQVYKIDTAFMRSKHKVKSVDMRVSVDKVSKELGLSEGDTRALLSDRLKSVNRTKLINRVIKLFFVFSILAIIYSLTKG